MLSSSRSPAIGIDLGTTCSSVAVFLNDKVQIIANEQGCRSTPSSVAFTDTEVLVGEAAKSQESRNPANTISDSKRIIGRNFDNRLLQNDLKTWPFSVLEKKDKIRIVNKKAVGCDCVKCLGTLPLVLGQTQCQCSLNSLLRGSGIKKQAK
ncbi:heat shock 70 kDa protein [Biomphalaria glabrata]